MVLPNSSLIVECEYPQMDYHWYRQNPDGTWSHKRGFTAVTIYDTAENIIYDPEICDRCDRNDDGYDYSIFCGYFQVSPLG